jgi:tetratricopeptide (TPR) repeat protein
MIFVCDSHGFDDMKLIKILVLFLVLSPAFSMDQKPFDEMIAHLNAERFEPVKGFLEGEHERLSRDPDYYVILLNYSFLKGYKEGLVVSSKTLGKSSVKVKDAKTGKDAFVGSGVYEDADLILHGIGETQRALENFRDRLDIHFGIIHIAEKIKRWDIVSAQSQKVLSISKEIDNKWIWGSINGMKGDPKLFMLDNIQAKVNRMFYEGGKEADQALMDISNKMIEEYPTVIYGYANLGVFHLVNKRYDMAEKYLTQAAKIDPSDGIVKENLEKLKKLRVASEDGPRS